jgi:two-component system copper resistance phosphate regulon response regulator CusR
MGKRLLFVDDEELHRRMLSETVTPLGFEVELAANGATGIALAGKLHYDVVLVDFVLEGENGFEVLQSLAPLQPTARLVLISAAFAGRPSVRMFEREVFLLSKPWTDESLRLAIGLGAE